jgi:hypothetical protein
MMEGDPTMPLRDHFHSPFDDQRSWETFHAGWPMMMVLGLQPHLPEQYFAAPRVHLRSEMEVDLGAIDEGGETTWGAAEAETESQQGGTATAVWAPPRPTLTVATDLPDQNEYEVRVYDARRGQRLVAAVEIVSPSNKDRPENRRAFVAKCARWLPECVCVAIVDLVTARGFNLYGELLDFLGQSDASAASGPSPIYAVSARWARVETSGTLDTWAHPLQVGEALPTLPLWLAPRLAIPLDLEASYEATRRALRIT